MRVAAAVATAMVGYGLVRSMSGSGGRGSVAAASALAEAPPMPTTSKARSERLDQLYIEIEELKVRTGVWVRGSRQGVCGEKSARACTKAPGKANGHGRMGDAHVLTFARVC